MAKEMSKDRIAQLMSAVSIPAQKAGTVTIEREAKRRVGEVDKDEFDELPEDYRKAVKSTDDDGTVTWTYYKLEAVPVLATAGGGLNVKSLIDTARRQRENDLKLENDGAAVVNAATVQFGEQVALSWAKANPDKPAWTPDALAGEEIKLLSDAEMKKLRK